MDVDYQRSGETPQDDCFASTTHPPPSSSYIGITNANDARTYDDHTPSTSPTTAMPTPQISIPNANRSPMTSDEEDWSLVYTRLKEHDGKMMEGYTLDMENLLVFAGLFSAVVSALLTLPFAQLQPDNTQVSAVILGQIYLQVANISAGRPALDSTLSSISHFTPSSSTVAINSLWILSLITSLAVAILAIFVKQWLREYMMWTAISPIRHAVQLRQYRFEAFEAWHVPTIVAILPALLQLALVLFLVGLLNLLWTMHRTVFIVACMSTLPALLCAIGWTLWPVSAADCPYKTPISWGLVVIIRKAGQSLLRMQRSFEQRYHNFLSPTERKGSPPALSTSAPSAAAVSTSDDITIQVEMPTDVDSQSKPATTSTIPNLISLGQYFDHGALRFIEYNHHNWANRDLSRSLAALNGDPLRMAAQRCRPLLWVATHNEIDPKVLLNCAGGAFASLNDGLTIADLGKVAYKSVDDPHQRMCAYWIAISEHLGYPPEADRVPLLDCVESMSRVEVRCEYGRFLEASRLFQQFHRQLATLNPSSREMMFHLLADGVCSALDYGRTPLPQTLAPFSQKNLQCLYLSSLYMMRMLCHRWSGLHPPYLRLLCRVITKGSVLHWDAEKDFGTSLGNEYGPGACTRLMDNVTAHIGFIESSPEALLDVTEAAIAFSHAGSPLEHLRFWSLANAALALQPDHASRADPAFCATRARLVRALLSRVRSSLEKGPEVRFSGRAAPEGHALWPRLAAFRALQPDMVSDRLWRIALAPEELKAHFHPPDRVPTPSIPDFDPEEQARRFERAPGDGAPVKYEPPYRFAEGLTGAYAKLAEEVGHVRPPSPEVNSRMPTADTTAGGRRKDDASGLSAPHWAFG